MPRFVITGTDTGIGKTVFSAALAGALGAPYWKPIQSGLEEESDSEAVARLAGVPVLAEAYRLVAPVSPLLAAEIDGVNIDADATMPPEGDLIVEGAGGALVPVTRRLLYADLFARWAIPVIICARTALGTINHSLLSIEAVKRRNIPLVGIAFIGDEQAESERIICKLGGVRHLGRLPRLSPLTRESLRGAFAASFNLTDFAS